MLDYYPVDTFAIDPSDEKQSMELITRLSGYDLVIAGVFNTDQHPNMNFGIKPGLSSFLEQTSGNKKNHCNLFWKSVRD